MKFLKFLIFLCLASCSSINGQDKNVLVFHKTAGFYHGSIPAGIKAIESLGEENGFIVTQTNDASVFQKKDLSLYDLIIFLNTTGDVLNDEQQEVFKKYIEGGGNFFGIHSASDTEFDWMWYGELVGAYFTGHPEIQPAKIIVEDKAHPTVAHLPEVWERTDEWYNFKEINPNIHVTLRLDESSYEGGTNGIFHPISWYRNLEQGGVSVYTGLGHTVESYTEPAFVEHLKRSILFALSEKPKRKEK
jgi:type 1 glutamine amidotransferase